MAERYVCVQADQRLEAVRQHNLTAVELVNGIDFVEVAEDQRTLLVRCLEPVLDGPRGEAVEVVGGVRVDPQINPVRVWWAHPASGLAAASGPGDDQPSEADVAEYAGLPDPDRMLIVRTSSSGDFSTYRFRISAPAEHDFDPQLAEVTFSFKVDCPSDFDCRPVDRPAERQHPVPPVDYRARDYHALRRLLLDRLSLLLPDWTDRSPADLGVTLVELFAYLGDHLAYAQDAVATEAYLGTARRRVSVRRHARLLDYRMHDGVAARAWLVAEVDSAADGTDLPAGTEVRAGDRAGDRVGDRAGDTVFHTLDPVALRAARSAVPLHTWRMTGCALAAGATGATLRRPAVALGLAAGDVLVLAEQDGEPARRWPVRLVADPEPAHDPITGDDLAAVRWHPDDAPPFPLPLDRAVAYGNVVLAQHGALVAPEELVPAAAPGHGRFRPQLPRRGLVHVAPYDPDAARQRPAAEALARSPAEAVPDLLLSEQDSGLVWTPVRDLLASNRFDRHYVVETEDDGRAYLRFGDNVHGQRPPAGTVLRARYRVGGGRAGNVGPGSLTTLADPVPGVRVHNPLPAQGGTDPEPVEQVRQWAPQAFRVQERAVTVADYAVAARRHPQVRTAAATRRWTGSWYTYFVTADRRGGDPVDAGFAAEVTRLLAPLRMAGHDLAVDSPVYVPLDIELAVCLAPGVSRGRVRQELHEAFEAFFAPGRFTFAQPVYASAVVATAAGVPGVTAVELVRFQRWGRPPAGERAARRITMDRLEVARCDSNPNEPEHGQITFTLGGGV